MWSKLKGWKERLLTQAGKEVLIKAMVQAIPAFTLSCFQLPDYFCKELETLTRKFWWGSNGDHQKMVWIKWDTMCLPKAMGERWDSEILRNSMKPYCRSRCGGYGKTNHHCSTRFLNPSSSREGQFLMQVNRDRGHLHGKAS